MLNALAIATWAPPFALSLIKDAKDQDTGCSQISPHQAQCSGIRFRIEAPQCHSGGFRLSLVAQTIQRSVHHTRAYHVTGDTCGNTCPITQIPPRGCVILPRVCDSLKGV